MTLNMVDCSHIILRFVFEILAFVYSIFIFIYATVAVASGIAAALGFRHCVLFFFFLPLLLRLVVIVVVGIIFNFVSHTFMENVFDNVRLF